MSYLNPEDIFNLGDVAEKYFADFDQPIDPVKTYGPGKMTWDEAANILLDKGWSNINSANGEPMTSENFVMSYIGNERHPERLAYLDMLDEEVSDAWKTNLGLDEFYKPTAGELAIKPFADFAHSMWSAAPSWLSGSVTGAAKVLDKYSMLWTEVDWKEAGKNLWHGNPDGFINEISKAERVFDKKYEAGEYDILGGALPLGRNLQTMEDIMAIRARDLMKEHEKDPRNRAYHHYMTQARDKNFFFGKGDEMGAKERLAYFNSVMVSPLFSTGAGLTAFAVTKNPALALKVAGGMSYAMEGTDEWNQSFQHYQDLGYSPENASRMSHWNAHAYGAAAFYLERIPMGLYLNKVKKGAVKPFTDTVKSKIMAEEGTIFAKTKVWKEMVKNTGKYMNEALSKVPGSKVITDTNFGKALIDIGKKSAAESLEEGMQVTAQTGLHLGYMEYTEATEGYGSELAESLRAGFIAGGGLATGAKVIGKALGGEKAEQVELEREAPKETPTVDLDRDKIVVSSALQVGELTDEETRFAGNLEGDEKTVLRSIERKGSDLLTDLNIEKDELVQNVGDMFGSEAAAKADQFLSVAPTAKTEQKPQEEPITATEEPVTTTESPFGAEGISDEDLMDALSGAQETDEVAETVDEDTKYSAMSDKELELAQENWLAEDQDLIEAEIEKRKKVAALQEGEIVTDVNIETGEPLVTEEAPIEEAPTEESPVDITVEQYEETYLKESILEEEQEFYNNKLYKEDLASGKITQEEVDKRALDMFEIEQDNIKKFKEDPVSYLRQRIKISEQLSKENPDQAKDYVDLIKDSRNLLSKLEKPEDQAEIQFQAMDQGKLPKMEDDQDWANRVVTKLKEQFPKITGRAVDKIVNSFDNKEQAGRAFNTIAEWVKDKATIDTAPHEYAHILIDAIEDNDLVQKGIKDFGSKEALVQYMGEYYANNMKDQDPGLRSRFKTFVRKFWGQVKNTFGKPSQYIAQQFAEGGEMFQDVDAVAAMQYRFRGQELVNEASYELRNLKTEHGITIERHPTDPTRLGTVIVPEDKRRQGLGSQVFSALKKEFIGKGKDLINIEVNPGAEAFWQKMGFTKTGEIEQNGKMVDTMEYRIPAEEMTVGPIQYQQVAPTTEGGRMAIRMLDNTLNAMQSRLGKKFIVKEAISKLAERIPANFAGVFSHWANKHVNMKKVVHGMAEYDAYATRQEFDRALDDVSDALETGLINIEPNDNATTAKHGSSIEYGFLKALRIDMPVQKLNGLLRSAQQHAQQPDLNPQEAFSNWSNIELGNTTGIKYDDIPDTDDGRVQKRKIKQLYVRANSTVAVNTSSHLIPRHRSLEYNFTGDHLFWKGNQNPLTKKTNYTTTQNMLYQAVNADKDWGNQITWLHTSDIVEQKGTFWGKKTTSLTAKETLSLIKKAFNTEWKGVGPRTHGLTLVSVRGDSGHFMFAPILDKHMDSAKNLRKNEAYWLNEVKQGNITKDQAFNFMGYRKQPDGNWKQLKNASQIKWLAGERARYEMMTNMMPKDMIIKGSEFIRRAKILSTPVFTSPLMRDTKAILIAQGDEKNNIIFVDNSGNEAPMVDFIRGLGNKNRTDGAAIVSSAYINDMHDAYGGDNTRKVLKTVTWKADLSLALKNEEFQAPPGMKIIRQKKNGERVTIAEVDDTGRIFKIDGEKRTEVDKLFTDDEAKHTTYKTGDVIDIVKNETGLIKYHERKAGKAKFPSQWFNYVHDKNVLDQIYNAIIPRVYKNLERIFMLTSSQDMMPELIQKYMESLRSDSPYAITTALIEKAKLKLGLHADAFPMLNKLFKTQIIDPALQLAEGNGAYLDLAPDYFGTHTGNEVSISQSDANRVYVAYAKKEGGTAKDAQQMSLTRLNKWLEENEVKALISRSPIPYIGGVFVGRIKSIHQRGGQIIISDENAIRRLEGDYDGDAVQIEFLSDEVLNSFETYLEQAGNDGRLGPVNLSNYVEDSDLNDLSNITNVYSLSHKFQQGSKAIGQIANAQNVFGQLQHVFESIETESGIIRLRSLTDKVLFPETGETISLEQQFRIWLQAAVDNGKYLLLDKWNYDIDELQSRIFHLTNADGSPAGKLEKSHKAIIKLLINQHLIPPNIRNGRRFGEPYNVRSLLMEGKNYLTYMNNREAYMSAILSDNSDLYGEIGEIKFKEGSAPMEDIGVAFARMWYGDDNLNIEARIEPGKVSPVEFSSAVYKTTHLNTMRQMELEIVEDMKNVIAAQEDMDLKQMQAEAKKGIEYSNAMYSDPKHGFIKLLDDFNDNIGPASWDHNPEMIAFTEYWNEKFKALSKIAQFSGTQAFLRGFTKVDPSGKILTENNRAVLPPTSDTMELTVLDAGVMKKYLETYNKKLRNEDSRIQDARLNQYSTFNQIVKKACQ